MNCFLVFGSDPKLEPAIRLARSLNLKFTVIEPELAALVPEHHYVVAVNIGSSPHILMARTGWHPLFGLSLSCGRPAEELPAIRVDGNLELVMGTINALARA